MEKAKAAKTKQNEVLVLREELLCKSEEEEAEELPLPPLPRGLPGLRTRAIGGVRGSSGTELRTHRGLLFVLQTERCQRAKPHKKDKWQGGLDASSGLQRSGRNRRSKHQHQQSELISPPPPSKEDAMHEPKEEDEKTEPTKQQSGVDLVEEEEGEEMLGGAKGGSRMTNSATQTPSQEPGPRSDQMGDGDDAPHSLSSLYHGAWPVERGASSLWHSGPSSLGGGRDAAPSVMSFTSSLGSPGVSEPGGCPVSAARRSYSQQQLGPKVEMVYGLLSMLGTHNKEEMSRTLLAMSSSPDSCIAMRQSGCLPLLVQLLHGDEAPATRQRAARALHNLVHSHPDDKRGRREARVLRLLEQVRDYCDSLQEPDMAQSGPSEDEDDPKRHPGPTVAALMKLSFDEEHRHAMCQLGGLHAVAQLIQADHEAHGSDTGDQFCVTLRRYAGMALTNLTFGDGTNKALLCSFRGFMRALVAQLSSPSEDLRQVTASVLRNLSWRADAASKQTLREVGAVTGLMQAAMDAKKESTLKSILSALWNLSAHCSMNKADICAVDGALAFLVDMLTYKSPSQTLAIIENAGGILRNISSHVAVREDYRGVLRQHNCLQVLLHQLKSPSLTVVSNACGTLWNLSARCSEDQRALWDMGAVTMLKSLVNSKHKMISMGSSAALKNLLSARPAGSLGGFADMRNTQGMPVLSVRKQRALEQELDQNLSETCDNIEPSSPKTSPSHRDDKYVFAATERHLERRQRVLQSMNGNHFPRRAHQAVARSESRESVTSTHSDSVYERLRAAQQHRNNRSLDLSLSDNDQLNGEGRFARKFSLKEEIRPQETATTPEKSNLSSPEEVSMKEQACVDDKETSPEATTAPIKEEATSPTPFSATSTPFAPRTNPYQTYFDDETPFPPVDYSLKYSEERKESTDSSEHRFSGQVRSLGTRNQPIYGAYAETDLDNPDQPTNFSLRYAEGEGEEEEEDYVSKSRPEAEYYRGASIHDDSVKTYCTEGTPFQTPLNFSTATSMSDLRETSVSKDEGDKSAEPASRDEKEVKESPAESQKASVPMSEMSSGVMSPEKPNQYCVEGTPVCFSRVSSLSSLHSADAADHNPPPVDLSSTPPKPEVAPLPPESSKSDKAVSFGAEETPLMFSRCSSLGSLSSFEQHSIHDDRSSIVSDFSRLTSGMISPSELPDSPTQTEPPSPRQTKAPADLSSRSSASPRGPQASSRPRPDVIEGEAGEKQDTEREKKDELATVSEEEENDEDDGLLDACISSGMQKNAQRQRAVPRPQTRFIRPRPSAIPSRIPRRLSTPPRAAWNDAAEDAVQTFCTEDTPANISHAGSNSDLSVLSHRESAEGEGDSPSERNRTTSTREESDDSSFSGDNEHILAECIQSGMPKKSVAPSGGAKKKVTPRKSSHGLCGLNHSHAPTPRTSYHPRALLGRVQPQLKTPQPPPRFQEHAWANDEVKSYAIEGTPLAFSNATSISDLTVNSGSTSPRPQRAALMPREPSDGQCYSPIHYATEDTPAQFSHASSLSSLHIEDEGAAAGATCSSDYRPRVSDPLGDNNNSWEDRNRQKTASSASEEVITVLSRTGSLSSLSVESLGAEQAILDQCISSGMAKSKSDLGTGKRKSKRLSGVPLSEERERSRSLDKRPITYSLPARSCSHEEGNRVPLSLPKNVEETEKCAASVPDEAVPASTTSRDQSHVVDTTAEKAAVSPPSPPLDQNANNVPQASPSKTAEEVDSPKSPPEAPTSDESPGSNVMADSASSSGALRRIQQNQQAAMANSGVMKLSTDTWNEDSPNSVSFPSLSGSVPLPSSQDEDKVIISRSMEGLLELEAGRVALAMADEVSLTSDSLLELVKPPSGMFNSINSLSTSLSGHDGEGGLRRVPAVVLRALNGGASSAELLAGNGEHLLLSTSSSCASNLENARPPPAMEEIDMENSMISVASITSEVAGDFQLLTQHRGSSGDSSGGGENLFELLRPAAAMAELYARSGNHSLSENLDNVNPPSTFNEITDLTEPESTIEPGTETLGSDTELEPEDLPVDSKTGTPIGSNDSTPKRRRRLTPKQRRSLLKDRYATYTIGTDDVEEAKRPDVSKLNLPLNEVKPEQTKTPKQRRMEDKERYLTQTIVAAPESPLEMAAAKEPEARAIKTARQKRLEDKDRFLTQTIESPVITPSQQELGDEDLVAIQREAGVVMSALQDPSESTEMLECETLSLISNDSETQHRGKESSDEGQDENLRPRIVKPADVQEPAEPEGSPKGIRGRRKALYSSPSAVRARGAVKSSTPSPVGARNATPAVRPTRASALRQRGASPRSMNRASSAPGAASCSPGGSPKHKAATTKPTTGKPPPKPQQAGTPTAPKPPNNSPENADKPHHQPPKLVKQGTFTKDSTIDPAVKSASKSRLPVRSPSADTITQAPAFRTQKSLEETRIASARATSRLRRDAVQPSPASKPVTKTPVKAPVKPTSSGGAVKPRSPLSFRRATGIKQSFSNHSLQSHQDAAAAAASVNRAKTSSNPNLNNSGTGTKKKEVTSKIASLWKKVEDSRNKQKYQKPDTRVWITANGSMEHPPLVRSSTFEKDEKPKPNSLAATLAKLTAIKNEHEAGKSSGANSSSSTGIPEPAVRLTNGLSKNGKPQASAVVQPYNYNPPPGLVLSKNTTSGGQQTEPKAAASSEEEDLVTGSVRVTSV